MTTAGIPRTVELGGTAVGDSLDIPFQACCAAASLRKATGPQGMCPWPWVALPPQLQGRCSALATVQSVSGCARRHQTRGRPRRSPPCGPGRAVGGQQRLCRLWIFILRKSELNFYLTVYQDFSKRLKCLLFQTLLVCLGSSLG